MQSQFAVATRARAEAGIGLSAKDSPNPRTGKPQGSGKPDSRLVHPVGARMHRKPDELGIALDCRTPTPGTMEVSIGKFGREAKKVKRYEPAKLVPEDLLDAFLQTC